MPLALAYADRVELVIFFMLSTYIAILEEYPAVPRGGPTRARRIEANMFAYSFAITNTERTSMISP